MQTKSKGSISLRKSKYKQKNNTDKKMQLEKKKSNESNLESLNDTENMNCDSEQSKQQADSKKYELQQSRKNKQDKERNYNCGCGKKYLSYPALYLHLRIKHNKKIPENTYIPKTTKNINQRGRPRVVENQNNNSQVDYIIQYFVYFINQVQYMNISGSQNNVNTGSNNAGQQSTVDNQNPSDEHSNNNSNKVDISYQNEQNRMNINQSSSDANESEINEQLISYCLNQLLFGFYKQINLKVVGNIQQDNIYYILAYFLKLITKRIQNEMLFEICIFVSLMADFIDTKYKDNKDEDGDGDGDENGDGQECDEEQNKQQDKEQGNDRNKILFFFDEINEFIVYNLNENMDDIVTNETECIFLGKNQIQIQYQIILIQFVLKYIQLLIDLDKTIRFNQK